MKIDKTQDGVHHELIYVRTKSELYFDKYHHTMSFFRTIFGFANILVSILIAVKVFGLL